LIKQGTLRFTLNKIPALAIALSVDAADVMRVALSEAAPDLLEGVERTLNPRKLTTAKTNPIQHLRKLAGNRALAPIVFGGEGVIALLMNREPVNAEFARILADHCGARIWALFSNLQQRPDAAISGTCVRHDARLCRARSHGKGHFH